MRERLGRVLGMTAKLARERFDQRLRSAGASFPMFVVLQHAAVSPAVSQRELASGIGIEGPTLVRHVDRLVADGLVRRVRDGRDRRLSRVELTDEGRAAVKRLGTVADGVDKELRGLFSPTELATLYELLGRIRDHYGKESDGQRRVG